jgi:hypothetical protein
MNRHVPLFPVDSAVLGVVGSEFNPSVTPPDCFAQGLLKADGTLDPSVPSQVVKFSNLGSPQLKVVALHGRISRYGVMSSKVNPAVALSATFNGGHVSNAVFGTIEPVTKKDKTICAWPGIHATFGMFPEAQLLHQPEQEHARWRCTEVVIGDTHWSPSCIGRSEPTTATMTSSTFFRHNFTTNETFVEFIATDNDPCRGRGGGGGRFGDICDIPGYVAPSVHRITITPDRGTISVNVNRSKIMPSVKEVKEAEEMFMECGALLQSKFGVIEWLEDHCVEPARDVNAVFKWMNGFQSAIIPIPRGHHALMPGMTRKVWERLMYIDPSGLSASAAASNRVIQPCECNPMRRDPECNDMGCLFKHSPSMRMLEQPAHQRQMHDRIIREEMEAKAAKEYAMNPMKKNLDSRALQGLKKALKDEERIKKREREQTDAAASPDVSELNPASTIKKQKKGGSKTRKCRRLWKH